MRPPVVGRPLLLASVLCAAFASTAARAHDQGRGRSAWTLRDRAVEATVWLSAADYQQLVGLDPDQDGVVIANQRLG